ncbi:MAG: carboxypeptidase regulatory-like domain-containing protein, partial [Acidobacteria bacterium]|nr:carboxypeptidase regulatory-like domain-containing protein [Acidobacteriota bacterium]
MTDSTGGVIADASVRVTNVATGVTREATTSAEGLYRALSLGPGVYRIVAEKAGFRSAEQDNVSVGITETVRVDFVLTVGAVTERVDVVDRPPQVETEQGRVSGRIERVQLKELPLNGRNLYSLIALQPGIVGRGLSSIFGAGGSANDSFAGELGPQVYASGSRYESNSYTLDDTSVNSAARGGITNLTPNADSVEEVRVVANNFSAVDGRNSGAQIQVIS